MPYTLSNAQQKELLVRGQPLLIALPLEREGDVEAAARVRWLHLGPRD